MKRLYRSNVDKKIGGVCGGIAEYFNVDPTVIRILAVVAFCMGWGFLAYLICWLVMPQNPNPAR